MDEQYDILRTARVIRGTGADLAGLQEVDRWFSERSRNEDTIRILAGETNMHYAYGANLSFPPKPGHDQPGQYGNAVLSKYPIVRQRHHPLSSFGDEQRGMLETELLVDGLSVRLCSVHLGLDAAQRKVQTEEIIAIAGKLDGPVMVTGDFNATPDSPEIQAMTAVFRSAFGPAPGAAAFTFPAGAATHTIDYIFFNDKVELVAEPVVVHDLASDHYPIMAKFQVRR